MTILDPGLAFWLGWAEHRGGLVEEMSGGTAVVVLPEGAQGALGLPEELAVTADPEAAREEGALLLVPGQPVLDRAAELVLAEGDSGAAWLPWPDTAAPTTGALVDTARDRFPVDHGRIDPAGEPAAVFAPLLRVGALVTYTLSLDLCFQEREEVWVDARTGLEMGEHIRRRLGTTAAGPKPRRGRPELPVDIPAALRRAHALVGERALVRRIALSSQAVDDRRRQLAAADAYYHDALESVARRRASATVERAALLDAQRGAIDTERSRRLAEIEATFTARHELRPFRAHLVFAPALQVPVDVRRGHRTYPFTLTWLLGASAFAGVRCPQCSATTALVAGRDHLGCRTCLPAASLAYPATSSPTTLPPTRAASPSPTSPAAPAAPARSSPPLPATPGPTRPGPAAARSRRPEPAHDRGRSSARVTVPGRGMSPHAGAEVVGRRMAEELWAAVRYGDRWPRKGKGVAADSPFAAALRVYGTAGAARAVGLADARSIVDLSARTCTGPDALIVTTGQLWTGDLQLPYSLRWSFDGAKPVIAEVVPSYAALDARLALPHHVQPAAAAILSYGAMEPHRPLGDVAAEIWQLAIVPLGLSVVLRALAAWWRVADEVADSPHSDPALAAGLVRLVSARAGVPRTSLPVAAADDLAVGAAARLLDRRLRLSRNRLW